MTLDEEVENPKPYPECLYPETLPTQPKLSLIVAEPELKSVT